jgi:DNA-binding CsgD family transcriptional regulator
LAAEVAATSAGTPFEAIGRSALGAMLLYSARGAEALDAVAPYLDVPTSTQALSCQVAATALAVQGDCARSIELGRRALHLSVSEPAAPGTVDAEIIVVSLALALELAGQLDDADRLSIDWYDRAAERSVHHAWLALVRMRIMLLRGELPRAAGFAGEAAAMFDDLDNQAPLRWALAGQMLAAAQMDERDLAARLAERLDAVGPSGVTFLETEVDRARAWLMASDGRLDEARRALAVTASRAESNGLDALAAAAWHDVVRLGGRGEAPERLRDLAARTTSELCRARAEHADACVADDPAGLLDAAQRLEAIGCMLLASEAAAHAVAAAQRRGEATLARTATARLRELRMRCSAAATPALVEVPMASLSPRERDVARLAASGLTSREIAERLELSVRTVDNLLQRAYMKLGVSGRRELPRVLGGPPA